MSLSPSSYSASERRNPEVWNDAAVLMADYDNQDVARSNFLQARLDGLPCSRPKELHGVMLELEATDGVKHPIALHPRSLKVLQTKTESDAAIWFLVTIERATASFEYTF